MFNIHKNKLTTNLILDKELFKKIENIFYEVQHAINTNNKQKLPQLLSDEFFKSYQKNPKNLFLNNSKIHIENVELKNIANLKINNSTFSVDILFSAITHTKHDKNTIHWQNRCLMTTFSPNKEIGRESILQQYFKQKWFFVYESKKIKVKKIKGIYLTV